MENGTIQFYFYKTNELFISNYLVKAEAGNYYLSNIFGEKKLTIWINLAAGVLLTLIVGGAL